MNTKHTFDMLDDNNQNYNHKFVFIYLKHDVY
jgi:hypothetical protein